MSFFIHKKLEVEVVQYKYSRNENTIDRREKNHSFKNGYGAFPEF